MRPVGNACRRAGPCQPAARTNSRLPLPPAAEGERCKLLMITLARPDPTEEEMTFKKGGS